MTVAHLYLRSAAFSRPGSSLARPKTAGSLPRTTAGTSSDLRALPSPGDENQAQPSRRTEGYLLSPRAEQGPNSRTSDRLRLSPRPIDRPVPSPRPLPSPRTRGTLVPSPRAAPNSLGSVGEGENKTLIVTRLRPKTSLGIHKDTEEEPGDGSARRGSTSYRSEDGGQGRLRGAGPPRGPPSDRQTTRGSGRPSRPHTASVSLQVDRFLSGAFGRPALPDIPGRGDRRFPGAGVSEHAVDLRRVRKLRVVPRSTNSTV